MKRKWTQAELDVLNDATLTDRQRAEKLGRSIKAVRKKRENMKQTVNVSYDSGVTVDCYDIPGQAKKQQITRTNDTVQSKGTRVKTLEDLIESANIDLSKWDILDWQANKWDVANKTGAVTELYQVKAKLKPTNKISPVYLEELENIVSEWSGYQYDDSYMNAEANTIIDNHLLEINIPDLHYGKLAWHCETGDDYDVKIAYKRYIGSIERILFNAQCFGFECIVLPIGSDFFHTDNTENTTTRGTRQDVDTRWQKQFLGGMKLCIEAIDLLRNYGPVTVPIIHGNHDTERSYYLGIALQQRYINDDLVSIDVSPRPRKYIKFGQCLLGMWHGDTPKLKDMPQLMASEAAELWGSTRHREIHLGHTHHLAKKEVQLPTLVDMSDEYHGCVIRSLRSLSGTDAWHAKQGYTGAVKSAHGFIWHRDNGVIAHLTHNY